MSHVSYLPEEEIRSQISKRSVTDFFVSLNDGKCPENAVSFTLIPPSKTNFKQSETKKLSKTLRGDEEVIDFAAKYIPRNALGTGPRLSSDIAAELARIFIISIGKLISIGEDEGRVAVVAHSSVWVISTEYSEDEELSGDNQINRKESPRTSRASLLKSCKKLRWAFDYNPQKMKPLPRTCKTFGFSGDILGVISPETTQKLEECDPVKLHSCDEHGNAPKNVHFNHTSITGSVPIKRPHCKILGTQRWFPLITFYGVQNGKLSGVELKIKIYCCNGRIGLIGDAGVRGRGKVSHPAEAFPVLHVRKYLSPLKERVACERQLPHDRLSLCGRLCVLLAIAYRSDRFMAYINARTAYIRPYKTVPTTIHSQRYSPPPSPVLRSLLCGLNISIRCKALLVHVQLFTDTRIKHVIVGLLSQLKLSRISPVAWIVTAIFTKSSAKAHSNLAVRTSLQIQSKPTIPTAERTQSRHYRRKVVVYMTNLNTYKFTA
ncbi:hypothetical protein J6590_034801 [Homalodisca vitripennis]|nr:hypothetical protein J6590_034801 [Homalodisca vitripennis]